MSKSRLLILRVEDNDDLLADDGDNRIYKTGILEFGPTGSIACEFELLAVAEEDESHLIEITADSWTIQHPLACRLVGGGRGLFDCEVNKAASDGEHWDWVPLDLGTYACDSVDGKFYIGDQVWISG